VGDAVSSPMSVILGISLYLFRRADDKHSGHEVVALVEDAERHGPAGPSLCKKAPTICPNQKSEDESETRAFIWGTIFSPSLCTTTFTLTFSTSYTTLEGSLCQWKQSSNAAASPARTRVSNLTINDVSLVTETHGPSSRAALSHKRPDTRVWTSGSGSARHTRHADSAIR